MGIAKQTSILSILVLLWAKSVFADDPIKPLKTDVPPLIDGRLDDLVWSEAPHVTGFKTWMPDYGIHMAEQTIVYIAYDRENLYFAFRCFDSRPDKIKTSITSRDKIRSDDWVCINMDSFNDQQSLYCYYINPAGIQEDSRFAGGREDKSIDFVWYSAGQIDEKGYTIEVRVPFKSIRFANKNPVEMGVIFERRVNRLSEQGTYPPLSPNQGMAFQTQMKPMVMYDIKDYTLFELLPSTTYSQSNSIQEGTLKSDGHEENFSLTTKYGLTSDLILDGTYNPDFSQVEADAGQVDINLRYALFFPEKRPFFLEGREMFGFSGSATNDPLRSVVHTRTIADPLAGIKLSGKIGRRSTIASIYALDELPDAGDDKKDYAHFAVLRYKLALHSDSYIGGFYTGREVENGYSRLLGIDGESRINESSTLGYNIFGSLSKKANDPSAREGYALGYNYLYATRKLNISLGLQDISKDFHTETGYLTRTGIFLLRSSVIPKFYPNSKFFRRFDLTFSNSYLRDKFDQLDETSNALSLRFVLPRSSNLAMNINYSTEVFYSKLFDTSGLTIGGSSQFTKQFYFKLAYTYEKAIYYAADPCQGRRNNASASMIYQPSHKINLDISLTYSDFTRDSDSQKIYDYTILRNRLTYQMNRYLFFRGIVEYNNYKKEMLTDFLASFTYIPGTVIHLGYGSFYKKLKWENGSYLESDRFLETKRGFFFKASYLWRM